VSPQWDPKKADKTRGARGLEFADACEVLDGECLVSAPYERNGEQRQLALGTLRGRVMVVVFTMRDGEPRIISFRKANSP
jgi:uncharacterized DUF497 family protein